MDQQLLETSLTFVPALVAAAVVLVVIFSANYLVRRNHSGELSVSRQFLMMCLTGAGLVIFIFSLPISETGRGQVLSLLGIVITAVIALSSTTFVSNIMAGLMLRAVNSFRPGDLIRTQDHFGRVTERGIFHTEIQTEDRDLETLPNMYLVNNPVTVVHSSGTIISANITLGYDIAHTAVERMLLEAAERTGLSDSFVLVGDLNDFSVSYRVGGFSDEVNRVLTTKSALRKNILDVIHSNSYEIVSPSFVNSRVFDSKARVIPEKVNLEKSKVPESAPEDMIFEKADSAAEKEQVLEEIQSLKQGLKRVREEQKTATEEQVAALDSEEAGIKANLESLHGALTTMSESNS